MHTVKADNPLGAAREWYRQDPAAIINSLQSDVSGLSDVEATTRYQRFGPNEIAETDRRGALRILWEQLTSALVILLLVAAVVSIFISAHTDAVVILAIVGLNAALGFSQDYRSEQALAALKRLSVPQVHVRRSGAIREISARKLVPGDIILLTTGNLVPADARILESTYLRTQEAALTGESASTSKTTDAIATPDAPIGDRSNMIFMGTAITYGHGVAIVTETGMQAELGKIAGMLRNVQREPTPLQRKLTQLGRWLAIAALVIVAVVFSIGLMRGEPVRLMFLTALSLAVAVVPEGLPAVATVSLALGARRMFAQHALIRKLPAVETLGSVTVICADKTGTLTANRMEVSSIWLAGGEIVGLQQHHESDPATSFFWTAGTLCGDTRATTNRGADSTFIGDPTEVAIAVAAERLGYDQLQLERWFRRTGDFPFDSERKMMSTIHEIVTPPPDIVVSVQSLLSGQQPHETFSHIAFAKGAVDTLLDNCDRVWHNGRIDKVDEEWRRRITNVHESLTNDGKRVLGIALKPLAGAMPVAEVKAVETKMIFVGMIGISDPLRPEVRDAVSRCKTAGIRPIMITGDHPSTAQHVAQQLDIGDRQHAVTGKDMKSMTPRMLAETVERISVFARVTPQHKLQIVQALQERGHVIAMTGDGVNDAPALKKADIGVAMGVAGTDVSKEAADMVLLDDNFATIVNAVETGRNVYDNIRKFVRYTLTSNTGELFVMLIAPMLGMPLPLLPLQILWINLVTDGVPGLALALEPAERNTMLRPPRPPSESVLGGGLTLEIALVGFVMGVLAIAAGFFYWRQPQIDDAYWRTIIFSVLTLSQMGQALAVRSSIDSFFTIGISSNRLMIASVALTFVLQLAVIYIPFFQRILSTTALSLVDLAICLLLSTAIFWVVEITKFSRRRANVIAGAAHPASVL